MAKKCGVQEAFRSSTPLLALCGNPISAGISRKRGEYFDDWVIELAPGHNIGQTLMPISGWGRFTRDKHTRWLDAHKRFTLSQGAHIRSIYPITQMPTDGNCQRDHVSIFEIETRSIWHLLRFKLTGRDSVFFFFFFFINALLIVKIYWSHMER